MWRIAGRQVLRKVGPMRCSAKPDGLTRKQAEIRLREMMTTLTERDLRAVPTDTANVLTALVLGERYLDHCRKVGRKDSTLTDYTMQVRRHVGPFFGTEPAESITAERVHDFITHLQAQGLAAKSVRNYVAMLSAVLNHAVRKRWLRASPMPGVDLPPLRDDSPEDALFFFEPAEIHRLAAHAQLGPYAELDHALYFTAALTGLRQGELRGLQWDDVDFASCRLRVRSNFVRGRRTTPKSGKSRSVPMAQTVSDSLLKLRAVSRWTNSVDPVFATPSTGGPMNRADLMERYRLALAAAGLPVAFRFHDLRHTFGTSMAKAGEPVTTIQAWMGHGDLKTTQRYMHYAPAADDAARIDAAFAVDNSADNKVRADNTSERTSAHLRLA